MSCCALRDSVKQQLAGQLPDVKKIWPYGDYSMGCSENACRKYASSVTNNKLRPKTGG